MSQSRRSARLVSGGYYQSDDDSDSSVSTNISYRESPVKVFKKKTGARKTTSRASSRANSTASTASSQAGTHTPAAQNIGGVPLLRASLKTQSTRVIHSTTIPTTASTTFSPSPDSSSGPAPTPAPAPAPNRTPILGLFPPPSVRPLGGLDGPSQTGGHVRLGQAQSGIDSSGYSSAEGHHRRSTSVTKTSGSADSSCKSVTWRGRARSAAAKAQTKIRNTFSILSFSSALKCFKAFLSSATASVSLTPSTRKALLLFLLLFLMALSVWYLFPMFTLLLPLLTTSKTTSTSSQREIPSSAPPVFSSPSPPPLLLPSSSAPPLPVSSPPHPPSPPIAMVSWQMESVAMETRMEKKMQSLLEDLMAKQETLYLQMKESVRLDLRSLRAEVTGLDGEARARLERHISGLSLQLTGLQTHSRTDTATLQQRVGALERHRVEMDKELLSIQNSPPPAPCPDTPTTPTEPHQNQLTPDLQRALEEWLSERLKLEQDKLRVSGQDACKDCARPLADKMADFALESQGASVVSTRCSETYVTRSACVTLFGFPLWYPSESPRTVIQGHSVMLPGKCWAFRGVQGALVLSLSHPISITHVTLDHLPRCLSPTGHIQSAPRDFQVHGMETDAETGTLLGKYTYDQDGESTQTFEILNPKDTVYRFVELRVLSNWGQVDYTCVYRFRVHGKIASS